ncbi:hypothetical protein K2173_004847 [Erythroxylum novogranatense]|uniref:Protein kinase domain-containing protein n=1 Tax=Erythroxylum novogranatense TaxID=1862640 RepID=A0AAV8TBA5_9ROSI|nr:hypothetical protein K2173_004847 [Erythroxylum novogranatense]
MSQAGGLISEVEAVINFLRKNGLTEAESALKEDMIEKTELGSFDFEKFLFELPPVRIPASLGRQDVEPDIGDARSRANSGSTSDDEFVSLDSSTSDVCSSEFTNPYGLRSASQDSESSSETYSQFGTARDYPDFDKQNDLFWSDDKDEGCFMTPTFQVPDFYGSQSEDKFVMTAETKRQYESPLNTYKRYEGFKKETSPDCFDKLCLANNILDEQNEPQASEYFSCAKEHNEGGVAGVGGSNPPLCKCHLGAGGNYSWDSVDNIYLSSKEADFDHFQIKLGDLSAYWNIDPQHNESKKITYSSENVSTSDQNGGFKDRSEIIQNVLDDEVGDDKGVYTGEEVARPAANGEDDLDDELLMYGTQEDEYEVFNLRIIHRKNRTGFEESKDLPIVLNTVIASRYYVTEYLGSAAFSKVVQAHDLHTGVDVCLKIIKNDKDFFDQSLDEIKLLKLVNKNDPADERHILRLYDYFYHQEHLFIVCELLKANLYEFQKFNQESGGEAYFTLSRLQVITRQCLEALEYLHGLGIIHCDLKPENILIKSYNKCEIKVIDLGSSCFKSDNLCLYVQSRSYRAPEVILGLPYDERIDIWSLGCILAELCSGQVLFPNDAAVMILARMIGMFGPIDLDMLERGQETHNYFTEEYDIYHMNEENQLEYIIPEESSLEQHLQISDVGLTNFVRSMLQVNPLMRPTAKEALKHPWLSHSFEFK